MRGRKREWWWSQCSNWDETGKSGNAFAQKGFGWWCHGKATVWHQERAMKPK